jgi:hypothetical protein
MVPIRNVVNFVQKYIKNVLDHPHTLAFNTVIFLLHVIYIAIFLRVAFIHSEFIEYFDIGVQIFIAAFLIYRFRISKINKINKFDITIILYTAYFIVFNVIFIELYKKFDFLKPFMPENILIRVLKFFHIRQTPQ